MKNIIHFRLTILLSFCFILFFSSIAYAEGKPYKTSEEPIAPGVVHESYSWSTNYGPILFEVLKCDLNNPDTDIRVVAGAGAYTERATVSSMANRTNAVAMVNGDFFNMALQGAPIGPSIIAGKLQSSPAKIEGLYSLGIDSNNVGHIEQIDYTGMLIAQNGKQFPIDGLNKTYYWHDPSGQESHTDTIQLYNDFWDSSSRGHANNTEVLVSHEGKIEKISKGKTFPFEVPDSKYILQVNGQAEAFIEANCPVGSHVKIISGISPDRNWKFLIGGHALLINHGSVVPYTKDLNALYGIRARTAAAISKDGKTVWFVSSEGRTSRSVGAHLSTMGYFLQNLGADTGLNLDGGGSTTMVLKHLGEDSRSTVIYPEGRNYQRAVVNGIGIYNNTPEDVVHDFTVDGPDTLIVGETGEYKIGKAWDKNYHAKNTDLNNFKFSLENTSAGAWSKNYLLALQPGLTKVQVTSNDGGHVKEKSIKIVGAEGLKSIYLKKSGFMVQPGSEIYFSLYGITKDNRTILLSPKVANWQINGFTGTILPGKLTVDSCNQLPNGVVTAQIGDLKAEAILGNNDYNLLDLYIGESQYWLNGKSYKLDQAPMIIENRTMVPIRLIVEAFNGKVTWDAKGRIVGIEYKGHNLKLPIDSTTITVDNEQIIIDVPAKIVHQRTLVPIRVISENLGMQIDYDDINRIVSINEHK